jgi:ABC-type branched-subunit amino acid transport system ATPase component
VSVLAAETDADLIGESALRAEGIDFSYGPVQVLFGVDFRVEPGEVVALLGVNGAGKSTLLRVLSGVGRPDDGRIHLGGVDITRMSAEKRVRSGLIQVPGGRAVFGGMTVVQNLRAMAYSLGRDTAAITAAVSRSLDEFPRLAQRRSALAANLSGGEQQMLALAKAVILQPKVLLIDELSLGLAPVIVSQLLDKVREISAAGVAVVLVEQSVNVALSIARRAYFMERGQVRFEGNAEDLRGRDDLLRAAFLGGAVNSLGGSRA